MVFTMPYFPLFIMKIRYTRALASITIPTIWAKQFIKPGQKHMFVTPGEPGELILMTEERYNDTKGKKYKPN